MINSRRLTWGACFIISILLLVSCNRDNEIFDDIIIKQDGVDMLSFKLRGNSSEYNSFVINDSSIFVNVPNHEDFSSLCAEFSHNGLVVSVNGINQESGITKNDFSDFTSPVVYTVRSINGEERQYKVHLFDIPVVLVNTINQRPILNREDWIPAIMTIIDTDGTVIQQSEVNIRGRGNYTWSSGNYSKKSYSLKFSDKTTVLDMPKSKRWVLLGHSGDAMKARTPICFRLCELSGMKWSPRGHNVEFVLNDTILCNYYLCEQIRAEKNRISITEMNKQDTIGVNLTGGVLFEVSDEYDEEYKFRSPYFNLPFMFRTPNEDVQNCQIEYFKNYIGSMEAALLSGSEDYLNYIDIDSYIRWWIVTELCANIEEKNMRKNFYMYKDRGDNSKLTAGPIWDIDYGTFWQKNDNVWICKEKGWFSYLFKYDSFKERVKVLWKEMQLGLDNEMDSYIDSLALSNYNSVNRDRSLFWVRSNDDDNMGYDEGKNNFKERIKKRKEWMNSQIVEM